MQVQRYPFSLWFLRELPETGFFERERPDGCLKPEELFFIFPG
jgi:hypothetical protein